MKKTKIFLATTLLLTAFGSQGAEIPAAQLPDINDFAIIDLGAEQYIAATNQGLFHSLDQGRSRRAHKTGYGLPATMVTATPDGTVYAFVVTLGLLELDGENNQWKTLDNRFGSQVLRQLDSTRGDPSRLVAVNQYGKLIVSENRGADSFNRASLSRPRVTAANQDNFSASGSPFLADSCSLVAAFQRQLSGELPLKADESEAIGDPQQTFSQITV